MIADHTTRLILFEKGATVILIVLGVIVVIRYWPVAGRKIGGQNGLLHPSSLKESAYPLASRLRPLHQFP